MHIILIVFVLNSLIQSIEDSIMIAIKYACLKLPLMSNFVGFFQYIIKPTN